MNREQLIAHLVLHGFRPMCYQFPVGVRFYCTGNRGRDVVIFAGGVGKLSWYRADFIREFSDWTPIDTMQLEGFVQRLEELE